MTQAATLTAPTTLAQAREHGLSEAEWKVILDRLGRAPNMVELGIFSVMWSEHCSYKSSRRHLRKLPTTGPRVIQGPGENAGVVDIGDGQACIFKMESHNHPSYIEPHQGAATGVGGILRDVFTMGARPVALMNALRFGAPDHPKTRRLVAGVVGGIGSYGNCVGVPTVGGETNFHKGYDANILVNAMAVGIADTDKIFYSRGAQPGSPIVYVGSKTGRDGIHGATMASAEFDEASEEKRPTVQVGDPFTEKLLIEACLELMATDAIEAIQDMGAAGLTSSSAEIAGKGGVGVELNMNLVPQRETGMTAYEMMLSESQERMLAILKPGREKEAEAIFRKWELDFAVIGHTTTTGRMVLNHHGEVVCDIPVAPLSEDAPSYDRPQKPSPKLKVIGPADLPEPKDYAAALKVLLACPDLASKRWIWEQYDRHVMADTVDNSETQGDAAIVRVHGTNKGLAITTDVTPRYCGADPFEGGKQAIAEAWRNLSAVGATPIAVTDCLNFGSPERPEIMGQFVGCIEGMAEACKALDMPVVSGNVSLYNETNGVGIPPTPAVGAVGLLADVSKRAGIGGAEDEDVLILLGATKGSFGQSLYLRELLGREEGAPPPVDLAAERASGDLVRSLIVGGHVRAVHDVSDGGALVAAAEMALAADVGVAVDGAPSAIAGDVPPPPAHALMFAEDGARFLVAVRPSKIDEVVERARAAKVPAYMFGVFGGTGVAVMGPKGKPIAQVGLAELRLGHEGWLPGYMKGEL